jgi:acyl-[acyl carrier protein]--UDP-N-acetylglucosamine O-acyltransferase
MISSRAIVSPNAQIGNNVTINELAIVEDDVIINIVLTILVL